MTSPSRKPDGPVPPSRLTHSRRATDRLRQLAFLHEFAQLLTQARDWDELMRTLVDRTTVAMGVEVCSFYLLDRTGERLTLAATNGLDVTQVGRVSLEVGQGITGRAAAERTPVMSADVTTDPRFSWVRGFDIEDLHAMLSVPLVWNEPVVGVLNVQTTEARDFDADEVEFLVTIAALLAGIVEKGRLQAEAEDQLDRLSQLDAARAELLAVVTHELRTPLAVVRAYVDLLADAAASDERGHAAGPRRDLARRRDRPGHPPRPSRRLDPGLGPRRGPDGPAPGPVRRRDRDLGDRRHARAAPPDAARALGAAARIARRARATTPASGRSWSTCSTTRPSTRRPSRPSRSACGARAARSRSTSPTTGRASRSRTGRPCSSRTCAWTGSRSRGSGIGLFAARRLMEAMGGRVWIEGNGYGGSRFVVALPVA